MKYSRGLSPKSDPGARPEPNSRQPAGPSRKPGWVAAPLKPLAATVAAALVAFVCVQTLISSPGAEKKTETRTSKQNVAGTRLRSGDLRPYAFSLEKLHGLSAQTPPGSSVELWVTRSRAGRADSELLTSAGIVKTIEPPLTPVGPDTAILLVPHDVIPQLMKAEFLDASLTAVVVGKP